MPRKPLYRTCEADPISAVNTGISGRFFTDCVFDPLLMIRWNHAGTWAQLKKLIS